MSKAAVVTKPRIKYDGRQTLFSRWVCEGGGTKQCGYSPLAAYLRWQKVRAVSDGLLLRVLTGLAVPYWRNSSIPDGGR